ncbi:hypothetical protein AAVH_00768 [Aphelenchoides avenae]|nr:hypothetical protein AAVH_00768 [Aphelenchus avenae]
MCYEDRAKKNFADMTWVHIQKSFSYAKKEDVFSGRKNSTMSYVVQKAIRAITCEWLLLSLVDLWHNTLDEQPCWQQIAPRQMRRLYHDIHAQYKATDSEWTKEKLAMFKLLGRVLHGSNPLMTWQLLKRISQESHEAVDAKSASKALMDPTGDIESIGALQRLQKDLRVACNLKSI